MDQRVYLRLENGEIVAIEGGEGHGSSYVIQNGDSDEISGSVQGNTSQSTSYVIGGNGLQNRTSSVENESSQEGYGEETETLGNIAIENSGSENIVYIVQHEGGKTDGIQYAVVEEAGSIDTSYAIQTVDPNKADAGDNKSIQYTDITNVQDLSGIETLSRVASQEYAGSIALSVTSGTRQPNGGDNPVDVVLQDKTERNNDENIRLSFYCQHCAETFEDLTNFRLHLKTEHDIAEFEGGSDVENEFTLFSTCEVCSQTFLDVKELEEHKKIHDKDIDSVSDTLVELNQDSKANNVVNKGNFKCRHCDKIFDSKSMLLDHVALEHPDKIVQEQNKSSSFTKCPYCHKMYVLRGSNKAMIKHIYAAHPGRSVEVMSTLADKDDEFEEQVKCPSCDLGFYWQKSLIRHIKDQHPKLLEENGNDIFAELGIKDLKTPKRRYRRSLKDDNEEAEVHCTECPKKFLWEKSLRKHMMVCHNESSSRNRKGTLVYTCPYCSLISKYACAVRKHIERKHPEEVKGLDVSKLQVPTVEADAATGLELKTVDKRPAEVRLNYRRPIFRCPFCSYASNQSSNLIRHLTSVKHGNIFSFEELKAIKIRSFKVRKIKVNDEEDDDEEENLDGTVQKRLPKLKLSANIFNIVMKKIEVLKEQNLGIVDNLFEKKSSDDEFSDMDIDNIIDVAEDESEESFDEEEVKSKETRRKSNTRRAKLASKSVGEKLKRDKENDSEVHEQMEISDDEESVNTNANATGNDDVQQIEENSKKKSDLSADNEMEENTRIENDSEVEKDISYNDDGDDNNEGDAKTSQRHMSSVTANKNKGLSGSKVIEITQESHRKKPNLKKPLVCDVCQKEFGNFFEFKEHLPSHVNIKVILRCTECDHEFSLLKDVKSHMRKEHYQVVTDVDISSVQTSNILMNGKPVTTYDCPYCEMLFSQSASLQQHIIMDHTDSIKTACIKQEHDEEMRHKHNETVVLAFNCQFCECFFHNIQDIVKHMYIVHKDVSRSSVSMDSAVRKSGRKRRVPKWLEEASDGLSPAKKTKDKNDGNENLMVLSSTKDTPVSRPRSKIQTKSVDDNKVNKEKVKQIKVHKGDPDSLDKSMKEINSGRSIKTNTSVAKIAIATSNKFEAISKKVPKRSENQISKLPKNRISKVVLNDSVKKQDEGENQNKCPHCDFVARRSSALAFHINIKHGNLNKEDSEEGIRKKPSEIVEKSPKKLSDPDIISRRKSEILIKGMQNNQSSLSSPIEDKLKERQNGKNAQGVGQNGANSITKVKNIEIVNPSEMMKDKIDSQALLDEIEEIENERDFDDDNDYDLEFGDSDDDYKPEKDNDDGDSDSDMDDLDDDVDEGYSVSESLECPYCKTGLFVKFSVLQSHVQKRHPSYASTFSIADVKSNVEIDGTIGSSNLVHTCKYCKKSFASRSHVRAHVRTKHSNKIGETPEKPVLETVDKTVEYYKCNFCNMLSNYKENILSHISREHALEREVRLEEIVKFTFKDSDTVQSMFKCPHCNYKSRWKQTILRHISKEHSDVKEGSIEIVCEKQLVRNKLQVKYQCVYCKWQYERKSDVLTHITETHSDQPAVVEEDIPIIDIADEVNDNFQCPYCGLRSKYKKCIGRHISRVHRKEGGATKDIICLSSSKTRNTVLEGLVYMCPYCDFDSRWKQGVVRHMQSTHTDVLNMDSEAIPSEYRLKSVLNLDEVESNEHVVDTDADYFKCPYCDSVSKSKKGIVEHTAKYHPKKPRIEQRQVEKAVWEERDITSKDTLFKCQACDSGSKWKKSVVLHMLKEHPEINKFHVDLCKAEFSKEGENSGSMYICQLCNELFTNTRAVSAHCIHIHPNEVKIVVEAISSAEKLVNVFKCSYCDHTSGWRKSVIKHVELHHPEITNFQAKDIVCEVIQKTEHDGTGGFQCPFCDTVNHWKKSIVRHIKTVHPQEDQNTPIHFNPLASIKVGGRSSRKSSKQIKCRRCKISCRSIEKMKRHFLSQHPKLAKNYLNKENTEFVYDSFAGRKLDFKCILCSAKYMWKKSLLVHMKNRHEDIFHVYQALDHIVEIVEACTDGLELSKEQNSTIQQIPVSKATVVSKNADLERRLKCGMCHMTFKTPWAINVHRRLKHKKCPNTRFPCNKCSLSFPTLLLRLHHKIRYHRHYAHRLMLQCTIAGCNFSCKFHKVLQNHYSNRHSLKIPILGNTTFSTYGAAGSARCEICLRTFKNKDILKQHVDLHKKWRPVKYQCGTCGEQFQTGSLRDAHIETFHFDKLEMCDICGNLYTRANLKKHIKIHDEDQSAYVTCQYCEQGVSTRMFNRHMFQCHQDIMNCQCAICTLGQVMPGQNCYRCQICKQAFCQKPMVFIHGKLTHADETKSKVFSCDACPQYFLTKRLKDIHCHEHHKKKSSDQSSAPSVSRSTSTYNNSDPSTHVIHIGQDEGKQYLPRLSDTSLNAVIKELLVFEKGAENPYKCLLCGRSFSRAKYIKLHIRRAHVRDEDQPYRCKVCGSGFVRLTEFRKHSRSHSDFRPYKCRYCDKAFKQQANLRDHYRVHTNSKEFKCLFCNSEFKQRGGLTSHVVFHDTLKPFKCMYCQKGFTTRGELSRHMQKYNKDQMDVAEKSYPCHICEETFPHYPMLLKHIDTHNPEKPFQCKTCKEKFANFVAMYFHKVKEGHLLPEEIQEGVNDLNKRGRKFRAKKNSIKSSGPEIVYKTNQPTTETIYVNQPEAYSEGEASVKPVEVIIENFDQEQVVRVQENEPEHEELLSIAKQLTELSGFAESEYYTTKKNFHQEEDEIIKTMLDADDEVLANLSKQSIVIKEPVNGREKMGQMREVSEQRDSDDEDYDYMPEIENDSSTAITNEEAQYVMHDNQTISLAGRSIPTNMEELVSLVSQNASGDNNEQVMAYQSEDGSVIYVCLPDDQSIKTEEVVAEGTVDELNNGTNNSVTVIQDSISIGLNMESNETNGTLYEGTSEKALTGTQIVVDSTIAEGIKHAAETDTGSIIHIPAVEQQIGTNHLPQTELATEQINQADETAEVEHLASNEIQMTSFVTSNQSIHVTNDQQIFVTNPLGSTSVENIQNPDFSLAESNFGNSVITIHPQDALSEETQESQEDLIRRSQLAKHLTGNIEPMNETSRDEARVYTTEHGLQSIGNEDNLVAHTMTQEVNIREDIITIPATAPMVDYSETNIVRSQVAVSDASNFEQGQDSRSADGYVEGEETLVEYQIDESRFIKEELLDANYAEMKEKDQEIMFFSDNIYTYSQQEKKFICLHCGVKIGSFKNLKNHIRRHAPMSARIHNCNYCPKRFVTKNELKRHLYTHTGERNHECKVCGKKFIQPGHLQEHMRLHTGDKPFKCTSCSAAFVTKTQLVLHWSRLHSDNEIPCDKCDKVFKTHVDLRRHKGLEHTGMKLRSPVVKDEGGDHICDICGQSFSKKASLKRHLEKHNLESMDESERVEERYECPECGVQFKSKYYVKEHIKVVHTKERNEICELCGEGFKTKTLLRRHKENKHVDADGNEKWLCKICNKSLGSKYAYGYHMGAKH